jgi:branched-chain amino acid transport system permease protein
MGFFDIYLLEAVLNGILLGGVLGLLALGLNLIFGVVDVVWIAYAELVMSGMYVVYWLHAFGVPLVLAGAGAVVAVAVMGLAVHQFVIAPILNTPPVNQLLATGGLLFFLQNFATVLFGTDFRNIGVSLPSLHLGDISLSYAKIIAFGVSIAGVLGLYWFLRKTFLGAAIRAISQDRQIMALMGVDSRKIYLVTSAIGGGMAGLAALLLALQFDVHPFIGLQFGPITFIICVLGGLGNMLGGFLASFIIGQIISIVGFSISQDFAYVIAFLLFILVMFWRPQGILRRRA